MNFEKKFGNFVEPFKFRRCLLTVSYFQYPVSYLFSTSSRKVQGGSYDPPFGTVVKDGLNNKGIMQKIFIPPLGKNYHATTEKSA